jgi:predicted site-specific integrase-resolvase
LEQQITDANTEAYPSSDQVAKILDVDKSTLRRWRKQGYLIPIKVGGKRRYRMSDVKKDFGGLNMETKEKAPIAAASAEPRHDKDNHFASQYKVAYQSFKEHPKTMLQVSIETGILSMRLQKWSGF